MILFVFNLFILFTYFWLHWVFVAVRWLFLVVASGGYSCCSAWVSHCGDFSCCGAQALGMQASVVVARGLRSCGSQALEHSLSNYGTWLSCSVACEILLDQGSNPCPLHWQADS